MKRFDKIYLWWYYWLTVYGGDSMKFYNRELNVRIKKIEFINFRNIEKGEVEFANTSPQDYLEGKASIMGLYGQNGSGKSSVIMALGILKDILSGNALSEKYNSCVKYGCNKCTIRYTFVLYNQIFDDNKSIYSKEESSCFEVFYDVDISLEQEEFIGNEIDKCDKKYLVIERECLKYRIMSYEGKTLVSKQTFIDTTKKSSVRQFSFGSNFRVILSLIDKKDIIRSLDENKLITKTKSQSFIFSLLTYKTLEKCVEDIFSKLEISDFVMEHVFDGEKYVKMTPELAERNMKENEDDFSLYLMFAVISSPIMIIDGLRTFGSIYLQVVDTVATGITNVNAKLPLFLWTKETDKRAKYIKVLLNMDGATVVSDDHYEDIKQSINLVSEVLDKIVPGLYLDFQDLGKQIGKNNEMMHSFEIISHRGDAYLPLKYESDGIRRIVSVLSLIIAAYNDKSFTIVIDEIDSGIFEYLLGEILAVISEGMKGQFIFTSHNLRALEVLSDKYLCFTTTDSNRRFTQISKRGNSNLRDTYFRTIVLNTHKEQVYNPTDRYEIEMALYNAGHLEDELEDW